MRSGDGVGRPGLALLLGAIVPALLFPSLGCLSPNAAGIHCAVGTQHCPPGYACDVASQICVVQGDAGAGGDPPLTDGGAGSAGDTVIMRVPTQCGCAVCPCERYASCGSASDCRSGYCRQNRCDWASSCREIHDNAASLPSGWYPLHTLGQDWGTFCEMQLDGGGWSLILKQTGNLPQLAYESPGWTTPDLDGDRYPDAADLATLTDVQLAVGYQVLAFSQIRMGFGPSRVADLHPEFGLEYVVADVEATSLQAAIAGDAYLPWKTPLPLDRWLKFDLHFQLAPYCVRQGFNVGGMLRVGIVSSADPDCTKNAATSFIGFGARGPVFAGNVCSAGCAANVDVPAYSVLMVR